MIMLYKEKPDQSNPDIPQTEYTSPLPESIVTVNKQDLNDDPELEKEAQIMGKLVAASHTHLWLERRSRQPFFRFGFTPEALLF
ncbi:MAG: hypothetical protein D3922_13030, partial [Candidatus Electrothrix sp. AR1]|nr:hypothetical protein [Candidatus Electrothrix sp. AR1]